MIENSELAMACNTEPASAQQVCDPAHATSAVPCSVLANPTGITTPIAITRRAALRTIASSTLFSAMACLLVQPQDVLAASAAQGKQPDRRLHLVNVHTGEELETIYWSGGRYIESSLEQINLLMRDHRDNEVMQMDTQVLDFLNSLQDSLEVTRQIQILSGYRSPKTNALLAKKSNRVAKNSLHMSGRAIDFRIPQVDTRSIRELALQSHRGGVGYYPKSDFLHIDSGPFRHWG